MVDNDINLQTIKVCAEYSKRIRSRTIQNLRATINSDAYGPRRFIALVLCILVPVSDSSVQLHHTNARNTTSTTTLLCLLLLLLVVVLLVLLVLLVLVVPGTRMTNIIEHTSRTIYSNIDPRGTKLTLAATSACIARARPTSADQRRPDDKPQ
jgi:hypothetical protein